MMSKPSFNHLSKLALILTFVAAWVSFFSPFAFLREFGIRPLNLISPALFAFLICVKGSIGEKVKLVGKKYFLNIWTFFYSSFIVLLVLFQFFLFYDRLNVPSFFAQFACFAAYFFISFVLFNQLSQLNSAHIEGAFSFAIYLLILFWFIDFLWPEFLGNEIFSSGEKGRTTGLFYEPTAVGVFSGFIIVSLLFSTCPHSRVIKIILGLIVSFMAIESATKIFVVFLVIHFLIFEVWRLHVRAILPALVLLVLTAAYFVFFGLRNEINVDDNLSVAFRLGSNWLTMLLLRDFYFIGGIGFGQFGHYAASLDSPDFLYASKEYAALIYGSHETRVSTYNMLLRLWVEMSIFSFLGVVFALVKARSILQIGGSHRQRNFWFLQPLFSAVIVSVLSTDSYTLPIYPLFTALCLYFYRLSREDCRIH